MTSKNSFLPLIFLFVFVLSHPRPVFCEAGSVQRVAPFEERHKDALALGVLYEAEVRVNDDGTFTNYSHKKVKILKDEAQRYGEVPIYYDAGSDEISEVEAFTITPEGKKLPYVKSQDLNVYNDFPMYSDAKVKMLSLPEVRVGSVLDIRFTIKTKKIPIPGSFWDMLSFKMRMPTKSLKISLTFPKKLGVRYKEFNLSDKPKITETEDKITYLWEKQDVDSEPPSEDFEPLPDPQNVEGAEFSSLQSWDVVGKWYSELIQKNLKITPEIRKTAQEVVKGKTALRDKVRAVLEYLQDHFRYVSMSFGANIMEPHPTEEVFRNKYGDCKDLSLLAMAILREAGVESNLALFVNEYKGSDPRYDLPIPALFDHVLLKIKDPGGKDFYVDPWLKGYDLEEYPLEYQGAYTLIIGAQNATFDRLPIFPEQHNTQKETQTEDIDPNGSAVFEASDLETLDFSVDFRMKYHAMNKEEKEKFYQSFDALLARNGEVLERRIEGLENRYGLLKMYSKYKQHDAFPVTEGMMIIDLIGYSSKADFSEKEREKDIFFPVNALKEKIITYRIPEGYVVTHLPENLDLDIGFFQIQRKFEKNGQEIKITEMNRRKRMLISRAEYPRVKEFFDKLQARAHQRIILKEKNEKIKSENSVQPT